MEGISSEVPRTSLDREDLFNGLTLVPSVHLALVVVLLSEPRRFIPIDQSLYFTAMDRPGKFIIRFRTMHFRYSIMEFDTFTRFKLPVIGVIGNDACWSQIARDQVPWFNSAVACNLAVRSFSLVVHNNLFSTPNTTKLRKDLAQLEPC